VTEPSTAPAPSRRRLGLVAALAAGGLLAAAGTFAWLRQATPTPPRAIAGDPVLVRGFEIYSARCASCHGASGRADTPLARSLDGPRPRNLVDEGWKYGDEPEKVVAVIRDGAKGSAMPGYGGVYGEPDLKATAAYLYHLTERSVPREFYVP
jgi:mono/diheme cytochrome c family protein